MRRAVPEVDWPPGTLLAALGPRDRDEFLRLGRPRQYEKDEFLMRAGEPGDHAHLIVRGYTKIFGAGYHDFPALLALRVAGDVVGELAVLDGAPRSATVVTALRTHTRRIGGAEFIDFLARRPAVEDALHRRVTAKFRQATWARVETAGAPVQAKVAWVLHRLGVDHGHPIAAGVRVTVPVSQADLAALAGVSEPSAYRALAALRHDGVILTGYRKLVLLDLAELGRRAAGPAPDAKAADG